jgi:hypothetical protein
LICKRCRITHAIIPSFSLPNRSIGTEDFERYLIEIEQGTSKYKAKKTIAQLGLSEYYPDFLDRSYNKYFVRAKALFPDSGNPQEHGLAWIRSVLGVTDNLIYTFNLYCLQNRINSIFCNRYNILDFRKKLKAKGYPHNNAPESNQNTHVDSS